MTQILALLGALTALIVSLISLTFSLMMFAMVLIMMGLTIAAIIALLYYIGKEIINWFSEKFLK